MKLYDSCSYTNLRVMFCLFVYLSLISALVSSAPTNEKIVGGEAVEQRNLYQVSLQTRDNFHICNGAILNKNTILSSSFCCEKITPGESQVVVGRVDISQIIPPENKRIITFKKTPTSVGNFGVSYDVCILKLNSPLTLNDEISAVTLPSNNQALEGDAIVSGWGAISMAAPLEHSSHLLSATIQLIPKADCEVSYPHVMDETMVCAEAPGKNFCDGDLGAPLVLKSDGKTLVGIASWQYGCAIPGFPGVFANVPYLMEWINKYL